MAIHIRTVALAATAALILSACAAPTESASRINEADAPASVSEQHIERVAVMPTIIDVRTPDEFAAGHVEGAINIDLTSPDFATKIAELDPSGNYALYCRSGNRSGQAVQYMTEQNFTNVTNLGSREEAAEALGLPIVH